MYNPHKKITRELSRLHYLFDNDHPDQVWANISEIIRDINLQYDLSYLFATFNDVIDIFYGDYPGYQTVMTPYHDLRHTMDVTMCTVRLMNGMHVSGDHFSDDDISICCISALLHDIGYAKKEGEEEGTGAEHTRTHVMRGIDFMQEYALDNDWPEHWAPLIEACMLCTDPAIKFQDIEFQDAHAKKLGIVVGSSDLIGQMADRSYLEKLLFLYFEFQEARMGNYKNSFDMLCNTRDFYNIIRQKLDTEFEGAYRFLEKHFQNWFEISHNYYMDSVDKNITYLQKITHVAESAEDNMHNYLDMLKRRGIVIKAKSTGLLKD